jgi:UDP-N-acetylmuramoylalanine--D-glutamate ligase
MPACELALKADKYDWIIAEISSYQIEVCSRDLLPKIGIWTTFTPITSVVIKPWKIIIRLKPFTAKKRSPNPQRGDDPYLRQIGVSQWQQAYWTSVKGKDELLGDPSRGVYLQDNWIVAFRELIAPVNLLKMVGSHKSAEFAYGCWPPLDWQESRKKPLPEAICHLPGVAHRLRVYLSL